MIEIQIDPITISSQGEANLKKAARARGVDPQKIMADVLFHVLNDDMIDAVLDD